MILGVLKSAILGRWGDNSKLPVVGVSIHHCHGKQVKVYLWSWNSTDWHLEPELEPSDKAGCWQGIWLLGLFCYSVNSYVLPTNNQQNQSEVVWMGDSDWTKFWLDHCLVKPLTDWQICSSAGWIMHFSFDYDYYISEPINYSLLIIHYWLFIIDYLFWVPEAVRDYCISNTNTSVAKPQWRKSRGYLGITPITVTKQTCSMHLSRMTSAKHRGESILTESGKTSTTLGISHSLDLSVH